MVKIGEQPRKMHIHNIYNPSSASYSFTDSPSTILIAAQQISCDENHILLGDFNLHHPYWSGPSRLKPHAVANQLLNLIECAEMSLTLPNDTITWEAQNSYSTIDLVFMSDSLIP